MCYLGFRFGVGWCNIISVVLWFDSWVSLWWACGGWLLSLGFPVVLNCYSGVGLGFASCAACFGVGLRSSAVWWGLVFDCARVFGLVGFWS